MRTPAGCAVLSLVFAGLLSAQTTSTEVLGTVTDASGAVVPRAGVTLLRVSTGEKRTALTDTNGNYSFPLIEIGNYTVTVEAQASRAETKTGITVALQQKARVNFKLEVGATTERVEVVASGVELKTDDAAIGATIDHKRVLGDTDSEPQLRQPAGAHAGRAVRHADGRECCKRPARFLSPAPPPRSAPTASATPTSASPWTA